MVGLTRLCLVSDKFLCMIRKSVVFLVDRYDRNVTMFRGYGGFYLITTFFRAFLLVLMAWVPDVMRNQELEKVLVVMTRSETN